MITITNGLVTLRVTRGAYEGYFKDKNFSIQNSAQSGEKSGQNFTYPPEKSAEEGEIFQAETDEDEPDAGNSPEPNEDPEVEGEGPSEEDENSPEEDETDDDEDYVPLSEIPLGEMKFEQLSDYADELGLDHDGVRSKKELRAIIRDHLNK